MLFQIFFRGSDSWRNENGLPALCGIPGDQFCKKRPDQASGAHFRSQLPLPVYGQDLPEQPFRPFLLSDIQYTEAVLNKFLIISQRISPIEMQPQEFPVFAFYCMVFMVFHAMDKKTGSLRHLILLPFIA